MTVTEITPNERFSFHSVMSRLMGWEFDFTMTTKPEGEGTVVSRDCKVTKFPIIMLLMRLLMPMVGAKFDKQCLDNMKADLEAAG